jgi:hypothetical protein
VFLRVPRVGDEHGWRMSGSFEEWTSNGHRNSLCGGLLIQKLSAVRLL